MKRSGGEREGLGWNATVASSLDLPRGLLPFVGELFGDVRALGCRPRRVVSWLRGAGIGRGKRIVDLGCGKGAASILAARRLGCEVVGVDACAAFIDEARAEAERAGVGELCRFLVRDLREGARMRGRVDATLMLGVLPIEDAAPMLTRLVRRGGVFVLDDAIALAGSAAQEERPTRVEAREFLASLGGEVVREHVMAPREYRAMEGAIYAKLARRAKALARERPRLASVVEEFLRRQRSAGAQLWRGPMRGAMWMVRAK